MYKLIVYAHQNFQRLQSDINNFRGMALFSINNTILDSYDIGLFYNLAVSCK